ncbi:cathepsin O isoform X2 [Bemisia tabaci]|uniref:cathepsin O isoform X2 n=1 Tax=Bemisia tabaci TaxID=7038 RepID=UPI0008F9BCE5|nr:PREDICTED: cathepsin O-like isoform X2 [Bemisia tabaci]XP_018910967.1 PREDICTED: cathepsin O-like isoform X2 [Bemisia tabaci]
MADWKSVLSAAGFIMLCFFGIPMNINSPSPAEKEQRLLFHSYVHKFNKPYKLNESEYEVRFRTFQTALKTIEDLNKGRDSNESALYGLTEFSDISGDEFLSRRLLRKLGKRLKHRKLEEDTSGEKKEKDRHHYKHRNHHEHHNHVRKRDVSPAIPPKKDWRDTGIIGKVRDQKTCGACWAFSTIETVESMYAMTNGSFKELSVQEVVDCAGNGNAGCNGGDTCSLLKWLVMNHVPVKLEKDYPLVLKDEVCRLNGFEGGIEVADNYTCDNFVGSESNILELLAFHGPVIAAVNALPWQYYIGGVIQYHCDGALQNINHAVQIVGYDTTAAIPHYIIRNSWGPYFGDNGYAYLAIGGNICGIGTEVSSLDVLQK